jgi:hypothetical protein
MNTISLSSPLEVIVYQYYMSHHDIIVCFFECQKSSFITENLLLLIKEKRSNPGWNSISVSVTVKFLGLYTQPYVLGSL